MSTIHTLCVLMGKWKSGVTIKSKVTHSTRVRNGPKHWVSAQLASGGVRSPASSSLPLGWNEVSPQAAAAPLSLYSGSWRCSACSHKPADVVLVSPLTGIGYFRYPGCTSANQRAPHSAGGTGGSHANTSFLFTALLYVASHPNTNAISPLPVKAASYLGALCTR